MERLGILNSMLLRAILGRNFTEKLEFLFSVQIQIFLGKLSQKLIWKKVKFSRNEKKNNLFRV